MSKKRKHFNAGENNPNWKGKSFTKETIKKLQILNHKENHPKWLKQVTKEAIIKYYIKQKKTLYQVGKELNCSGAVIWHRLRYYKIHIRTQSENMKGRYKGRKLTMKQRKKISNTMD